MGETAALGAPSTPLPFIPLPPPSSPGHLPPPLTPLAHELRSPFRCPPRTSIDPIPNRTPRSSIQPLPAPICVCFLGCPDPDHVPDLHGS